MPPLHFLKCIFKCALLRFTQFHLFFSSVHLRGAANFSGSWAVFVAITTPGSVILCRLGSGVGHSPAFPEVGRQLRQDNAQP